MKKSNLILLGIVVLLAVAVIAVAAGNKTYTITVTTVAEDGAQNIGCMVELTDPKNDRYMSGGSLSTDPDSAVQFGVKKGSYVLTVKNLSDDSYSAGDPVPITVSGDGSIEITLKKIS